MILAIDQGTTGTTVMILDHHGSVVGRAYREFAQHYPQPGWVEHDPLDIWQVSIDTIGLALTQASLSAKDINAIGITNQRETTVVWDRDTGKPLYNAIVWQCRRSSELCDKITKQQKAQWINEKTGLVVDAYFCATKIQWLFDNVPGLETQAKAGRLCFGTIDSWLIWCLSGGREHVTDHTNAARTMLYNLDSKTWDESLLDYFNVPASMMPTIKNSSGLFANTDPEAFFDASVPIMGVAGDQQAALFGQRCVELGAIKNTYGTGCFMLMYTGSERPSSSNGLLSTIACDPQGRPAYALEGSVFSAGAAVQWLRDELGIISSAGETEGIAAAVDSTLGVYMVPAFTGLGAPYWDMAARGSIVGLTRGAGRAEIVRATLESIAYQSRDLADLMAEEANMKVSTMRVDGGAANNNFLMQLQADILNIDIQRPVMVESTAIGAALLAGIGANIWNADALPASLATLEQTFRPSMANSQREQLYQGWQSAVKQARG